MIDEKSQFYRAKNFNVRYSEMDYKKQLKPSALLNFLQDVATFAADECGFGYNEIVKQNLGWFLLKYHMEFCDYPQNIEDIYIKTEARGYNKLFALRDFEIYSASDNKLLGRIISQWGLVNMQDKSMVQPKDVFPFMYKQEKRDDDLSFEKIKAPDSYNSEKEFEVRYDDIDVNKHVNNMNYIIWGFETLPYDFRASHKLKTLDMLYKKEIQYGHTILTKTLVEENTTTHTLLNKDTMEELCIIKAQWDNC